MDLNPYLTSVRDGVTNAAALADDTTQQVAQRLGAAIESSTRLALISALSDAASDISADLAPASVTVRMVGQDPELVVSVPTSIVEPTLLLPQPVAAPEPGPEEADLEEEAVARISLRLPSSVKTRVDELADRDGISTNAWLIRAVMDALAERRRGHGGAPQAPTPPVAPLFGFEGPFGPNGVFGPAGVFGAGGPFGGGRSDRPRERADRARDRAERHHPDRSGTVQGWVR